MGRTAHSRKPDSSEPPRPRTAAAKPAQSPPPAPAPKRRLSASDRRREIVAKSIEYFAKVGFEGGTRELARHLGTTQPLLYRYFPNKDALIQEIYKVVYLDQWKASWDHLLTDASRPLRARLQIFYEDYTDAILNPQWMRIYFFAGLKGVSINERYLALVEERILSRILREFQRECGLVPPERLDPHDLEIAWHLQGGIFYYGVRRFVYRTPVHLPKSAMITDALDVFFAGYRSVLDRRRDAPAKA
ncbi:TetR/AcrR family transcriptional regulator [Aquabacter spiritensis]|uniref:TetR family transcriptional regulator n=1 Tax=Aquabacter spiritensis TaxID=933073 RepID=A0A4R3LZU7_9HYPH|nr:TetR/AcrR family transcriptional regulator [Aquabacter spiritensis]TCT05983.1 TetR family transcriptional regulator [Aquabacter spiritensis]